MNGNLSNTSRFHEFVKDASLVIAADGGVAHLLARGMYPDIVVGDFDSTPKHIRAKLQKKEITLIHFPPEKDYTDSELAVKTAIEKGAREIIISGLLGDRIDHMIANVLLFAHISETIPLRIIDHDQDIFFVRNSITISGQQGDEVSLIALSDAQGVTTRGLVYPLDRAVLSCGITRGVSNVMKSTSASISVETGMIMVVHRVLERTS